MREQERATGQPYTAEIPLLLLLFRAFECWDELYWNRIGNFKNRTRDATLGRIGLTTITTAEERMRSKDLKRLQTSAKLIEREKPIDPHLVILGDDFKRDIVDLFVESFLHSQRVCYLFNHRDLRLSQKPQLKWFASMLVDYFFDHNAFFWGYISDDNKLLGVSIWERPDVDLKISMYKLVRASGAYKLGPTRFLETIDIMQTMEKIRADDIGGIRCWMLHWLFVSPFAMRNHIAQMMVENCAKRHSEPVYVQLFDKEIEALALFQKLCFFNLRTVTTNYSMFNVPLKMQSMWHGLESPEELRAKSLVLQPKKKSALALTYSTLRKMSSGQITMDSRVTQTIMQTYENPEYKNAKLRYEEASLLLDALKINLGQLPVLEHDDELTLDLKQKIHEQESMVSVMKRQMEFYAQKPNPQKMLAYSSSDSPTRSRSPTDFIKRLV